MRIGLMLRAYNDKGGVGVYTRNIAKHLIESAPDHQFFLYLPDGGKYEELAGYPNAVRRIVKSPGKAAWDQIAIPYWYRRDGLDVIFHTKFTVPLLCRGKSVMVLHGAGWFIRETQKFWSLLTRIYARIMMPIYCRSAGKVISVSEITRDVFISRLGVAPDKIKTIYFAPGIQFKHRLDNEQVDSIRKKYRLPETFVLTISGGDRDDRKNFGKILEAFRLIHESRPVKLVVAGRDCEKFRERYAIPDDGYGKDIVFPGWVDQADLPALYQMARVFLYPSNMEAHPIPVTEALATATPMVTSNVYGLKELAGEAALLIDPSDPDEIAGAVLSLLEDDQLRRELAEKARDRSHLFDWERCARATLDTLEQVANQP